MGKNKKDFFSKSGRAGRAEGLKEESGERRWCYCAFFGSATIITAILGVNYAFRAANAHKINKDFGLGLFMPYDWCAVPGWEQDPSLSLQEQISIIADRDAFCSITTRDRKTGQERGNCEGGTRWTTAFTYNAIVLFLMSLNFVMMTFGAFFWTPRLIGTICNFCCSCCHIAGWATALGYGASPMGRWCAMNIIGNQYKGNASLFDLMGDSSKYFSDQMSYKKDQLLLLVIGAIQLAFWVLQCYCCWLPLYWTPSKEAPAVVVHVHHHHTVPSTLPYQPETVVIVPERSNLK